METASRSSPLPASQAGPPLDHEARAAARGDVTAFERVYRASVPRVFALACRLLGAREAEEATQEVYLRAWSRLGSWRGEASFSTWLQRLALNALLNRRASLRAALVTEPVAPEPRARFDAAALRLDLEAALERLPAGAREVFVLHDVEGHRHAEIAELLSVSVGTSKSQLHRARLLLRGFLGSITENEHE